MTGSNQTSDAVGMGAKALLDDCFAHDPKRMPAADALALLRSRVTVLAEAEDVPLGESFGRILAEDVSSARDVPSFDNVAVDGFAFAHASLASGPTRLPLVEGRAAAGHPFEGVVPEGHAVRVLTGGALPEGADTALMQEDVTIDDDDHTDGGSHVVIPGGVKRGANCRLAGEDMREGQVVLRAGRRLRPHEVGVAATVGRRSLSVYRPLRVALVSSGDELREPGEPLPHGMTYDSNRTILRGLLESLGVEVSDQGIWPDRADVVQTKMAALADDHHAIITSGGASRGDEDHMVDAVRTLGQVHFWQIAVKPGRPLAFGQLRGRRGEAVFVGLPGNPVAAVVCFLLFARPLLTALGGGAWPTPNAYLTPSGFSMKKKPGRREYLRAKLFWDEQGNMVVKKIEREGSGILTSLTEADGLIDVAEDVVSIAPGDPVPFMPFSEFGL